MTASFFRHGEGRSFNARNAEFEGRMPLSRAKKAVADQFDCSQTVAATALELLHDGEWHHVGKFAAEVAYYDSADIRLAGVIKHILAVGGAKKFAARRAELKVARDWTCKPAAAQVGGRFSKLAARRAKSLAVVTEALGRNITERHRLNDWNNLWSLCESRCYGDMVAAARVAGWSNARIAMALASAGHSDAEWLRNILQEAK